MEKDFYQKIKELIDTDSRYKPDAYEFLMEALHFTQKKLSRKGHITGKELLEGIREYAPQSFGPMARTVLEYWGITKTDDFGEMVFKMVENGLLSKRETDSREDFREVYDFKNVFDSNNVGIDLEIV